jgi:hypothetical protein
LIEAECDIDAIHSVRWTPRPNRTKSGAENVRFGEYRPTRQPECTRGKGARDLVKDATLNSAPQLRGC